MSATLYTRDILRLAVSIPHQGRLQSPHGTAEIRSRTCGSVVSADVCLSKDQLISDIGIEVNACALGQASAAILAAEAMEKNYSKIQTARDHLARFLDGSETMPGLWENMNHLSAAKEHAGRHSAILLPYDALLKALEMAMQKHEAA